MSGSGSGLSGAAGLWLAAGASVVIVGGAAWYSLGRSTDVSQAALVPTQATPVAAAPAPDPVVEREEPAEAEPPVETTATEDAIPAEDMARSAPAPVPDPILPAFDEVRREGDGMTIIAGRAAPGAILSVLQNGVEVTRVTADSSGKFATFLMIPPSGEGHVLSLEQIVDGQVLASDDQIILAPIAVAKAPAEDIAQEDVALAEAAPEPEPAPETPVITAEERPTEEEPPAEVVAEAVEAPRRQTTTAEAAPPSDAPDPPRTTVATAPATPAAQALATDTATSAPQPPADDPPAQPVDVAVAQVDPPATPTATARPTPAAPTASVVLKSTSDGVELLNTQPPEVMKRVALDTISYSDLGDVQLSGRAQVKTQSVRVYLNNAPIADLAVDAAGRWRGDLPDIDEGVYTLRVDEVAADGSVTSRVETPFKREDPAVLVQAAADQDGPLKRITVQRGNTLWAIARERYGDGLLYVRVFQANADDIRDPDLIYPGQVFDLPD